MKIVQSYRVDAITIATNQPEELAAFYQQAFNMPAPEKKEKDQLTILLENLTLIFERADEKVKSSPGGPVIWLSAENVEEVFTQAIAAGARARTNVNKDERPGYALAVLYDLDDNLIGLIGPSAAGGTI